MVVALILAGLALTCVGIFGWLWLCAGFRAAGWRGVLGKLALQLSAVCLVYGFLRGQPFGGLFMAAFPPFALAEVARAIAFKPFLTELAWGMAPYAAAVLLLCLAIRPLRGWSLGITVVGAMLVSLFVGDQISQSAMCATAAKRGFDHFDRTSFAASLTHARQDLNFAINAKAEVDGQTLGWTYSAMDWQVLSERVAPNVAADAPFTCPSR